MKNISAEISAAEMLLDIGVSLPIFKFKLPFVKKPVQFRLTMKRPCLGSMIRIARLFLQMDVSWEKMSKFNKDDEIAFIAVHGHTISKIIAMTILRSPYTIFLTPILAFMIRWFVPDIILKNSFEYFTSSISTKSFMNIIKSLEIINPLEPKLSQQRKGS